MANQSLISVPTNVDDPVVLRRFLSRLVEQLDIVVGNRADNAYVTNTDITSEADALTAALNEAENTLRTATEQLEETLSNLSEDFSDTLAQANVDIRQLQATTFVKAGAVKFTLSGTTINHLNSYNIDESLSNNPVVGVYRFKLKVPLIFGTDAINEAFVQAQVVTASTTPYQVRLVDNGSGVFDLHLYKVKQGVITNTKLVLTDLGASEELHAVLLFSIPGSANPPVGL